MHADVCAPCAPVHGLSRDMSELRLVGGSAEYGAVPAVPLVQACLAGTRVHHVHTTGGLCADRRVCCCCLLCWLLPCACRLTHVACKCVLTQLPADSLEAQQQWPYALALAAGEAVAYAKQHLDRCAWAAGTAAAARGCASARPLLLVGWQWRRRHTTASNMTSSRC